MDDYASSTSYTTRFKTNGSIRWWKKSKTKEGITAYDITFAVMDVAVGVKDGMPKKGKLGEKGDLEKWQDGCRAMKEYRNSAENLKKGKKGGKRGVIERKREKVIKNRKKVLTGDKSCDIISELRPGRTKQEP